METPGHYVFCDDDTPFYPGYHPYGSGNWTRAAGVELPQLGDVTAFPAPWYNGEVIAELRAAPVLLGDADCVVAGEQPPTTEGLPALALVLKDHDSLIWELEFPPFIPGPVTVYRTSAVKDGHAVRADLAWGDVRDLATYQLSLLIDGRDCGTFPFDTPVSATARKATLSEEVADALDLPSPVATLHANGGLVPILVPDFPSRLVNEFFGGFQLRCYLPEPPPPFLPSPPPREPYLYLNEIATHLRYAEILRDLYVDADVAALNLHAFTGSPVSVWPNSDSVIPGMVVSLTPRALVVCISGTTTPQQFALQAYGFTNATIGPDDFRTSSFWFTSLASVLARLMAVTDSTTIPVRLVGHSYGGALACLVAAMAQRLPDRRDLEILTFGCPKPGHGSVNTLLRRCNVSYHYANTGDPIPNVPPRSRELGGAAALLGLGGWRDLDEYRPPPGQVVLHTDGRRQYGLPPTPIADAIVAVVSQIALGLPAAPFEDHFQTEYVRRLTLAVALQQ